MEELAHDLVLSRIEELTRAVKDLQRRVTVLERGEGEELALGGASMAGTGGGAAVVVAGAGVAEETAGVVEETAGVAPLFGWALLGIAGAYLLRAASESGTIPGIAGAMAGIAYAAWWLFLAAKQPSEKPLRSTVHGLTAALILVPMLWETTVRFHLLAEAVSSAAIIFFAWFGLALAWRQNLTSIAWIVTVAGLLTSTALFRETHNAAAWMVTLLCIATAVEFSACRDHWLSLRWLVALITDLSVLTVTWLAARGEGTAQGAAAAPAQGLVLGTQIALLTIYLSSTVDRTIFRGLHITWFEIGQAAAAFAISIGGALYLTGTTQAGAWAAGLFCLLGGGVCYLISFVFLDRSEKRDRNFYTYSTFAILLVLAGCRVLLDRTAMAGVFAALAAAALVTGFVRDRNTLRLHSAVYLALALAVSGLLELATARLMRFSGGTGALSASYVLVLTGGVVCYAIVVRWGRGRAAHWADSFEAIFAAALAVYGTAGVLAGWMTQYVSEAAPLRTALLTAMAMGAGWASRAFERVELARLAYPLLALAGIKMAADDFQEGRSLTLFASLIFFGCGLILMPRLLRRPRAPG